MEAESFMPGCNFLLQIESIHFFSVYVIFIVFLFCRLVWEGYHLTKDNFQFLGKPC